MTEKRIEDAHDSPKELILEYVEKRIFELQSIRDQYSGAIEAYKDVLTKIQERNDNEVNSSETSVET